MKYLVYISAAKRLFTEQELFELLLTARKNNEESKVTGMLLYSQGTFIQVLEGEDINVDRIFKNIELDLRHKNIIKLLEGDEEERIFPEWSMAYASVNAVQLRQIEGYLNPSGDNFIGNSKHSVLTILRTFAENNNLSMK